MKFITITVVSVVFFGINFHGLPTKSTKICCSTKTGTCNDKTTVSTCAEYKAVPKSFYTTRIDIDITSCRLISCSRKLVNSRGSTRIAMRLKRTRKWVWVRVKSPSETRKLESRSWSSISEMWTGWPSGWSRTRIKWSARPIGRWWRPR